jgi:hypothetical protein
VLAIACIAVPIAGCLAPPAALPPPDLAVHAEGCEEAATGGLPYLCAWRIAPGDHSALAIAFDVTRTTRFEVENEHTATWHEAQAFYHFRVLAMATAPFGIKDTLVHTGAQHACAMETAGQCATRTMQESRGGGFTFTLEPGRYLLLYAFFGASETSLTTLVRSDAPLARIETARSATSLVVLQPEQVSDDRHRATWRLESDVPLWATVRGAGRVLLEEITMVRPEAEHLFVIPADVPAWQAPAHWGDGILLDTPNLAYAPGTAEVRVTWRHESTAAAGAPIIGLVHAPLFVDSAGCMARYGPGAAGGSGCPV